MKTIYLNGNVYTGAHAAAEAFAVENGRFLFAGSGARARELAGAGDAIVDLGGRFVCPSFIDSHMHLLHYGQTLRQAPLARHTGSLRDMLDCLRAQLAAQPVRDGGWLVGWGWNQDYFSDERRLPTRDDLDQVSETVPICAVRACGHCLAVNSKVLSLLGITAATPQPAGGRIGLRGGQPDGTFFDNAIDLVSRAVPVPGKEEIKDRLRAACRALNAYGVTSCHTDDYYLARPVPWTVVNEAYRELEAAGELTVRVYEQANFPDLPTLRGFVEAGNVTGTGSDHFRIGPLKMIGDGSLGARTAFLSQPYADAPDTTGLAVFSQETLDEMIGYANRHGMQAAVHAIGDACLDRVLNAYEKALSEHPRPDHRHGIIHCQITRPDQLERIRALGLHVYCQSIFLDYDTSIVLPRVGPERARTSYCWKTLLRRGVSVSNGSDCPVEAPDVMAGLQCAVTRASFSGDPTPYLPEEAFTVGEALDSYTIRGAEASFEENVKGRIRPGMLADFVVLGADPFRTEPTELRHIPVLATVLGGRLVFGSLD